MVEIWKPFNRVTINNIEHYTIGGDWYASSHGNIMDCNKQIIEQRITYTLKHKIQIPTYKEAWICFSDNIYRYSKPIGVHRLVGYAFLDNPCNKPCINHKDCNGLNNYVDNLEWVTHKENAKHAQYMNKTQTCTSISAFDIP